VQWTAILPDLQPASKILTSYLPPSLSVKPPTQHLRPLDIADSDGSVGGLFEDDEYAHMAKDWSSDLWMVMARTGPGEDRRLVNRQRTRLRRSVAVLSSSTCSGIGEMGTRVL